MRRFILSESKHLPNRVSRQHATTQYGKNDKSFSRRTWQKSSKWMNSLQLYSVFNTRANSETENFVKKKEILIQQAISVLCKDKPTGHVQMIDHLLNDLSSLTDEDYQKDEKDVKEIKLDTTQVIHSATPVNTAYMGPPYHRCESSMLSAPTILQATIEARKFQNMYGVEKIKVSASTIVSLYSRYCLLSIAKEGCKPTAEMFFYLCTMLQITEHCDINSLRNINQVIKNVANDFDLKSHREKEIMKISGHLQLSKLRNDCKYSSSAKEFQAAVKRLCHKLPLESKKRDLATAAAFDMLLSLNKEARKEGTLVTYCVERWQDTLSLVSLVNPRLLTKSMGTVHAETRAAADVATSIVCPMTAKKAHEILEKVSARIESGKITSQGQCLAVTRKRLDSISEMLQYSHLALNIISGTSSNAMIGCSRPNWALAISFLCQGRLYDIAAPIVPYYHKYLIDMSPLCDTSLSNIIPEDLVYYIRQVDHCRKEIALGGCIFKTLGRWITEQIYPSLSLTDAHLISEGAQIAAAEMLALLMEKLSSLLDSDLVSQARVQESAELNIVMQLVYFVAFSVFNRLHIAAGERDFKYSTDISTREQKMRSIRINDVLITEKGERLYLRIEEKNSVSTSTDVWQGVHFRRFLSLISVTLLRHKNLLSYRYTPDVIDLLLFRLQLLVSPMLFQNNNFTSATFLECPQEQMRALYAASVPSLLNTEMERDVHNTVLLRPHALMVSDKDCYDNLNVSHTNHDDLLGIAALLNRRWPRSVLFRHLLHECVVVDTCIGYPRCFIMRENISSKDYSLCVSAYMQLISSILRSYAVQSESECMSLLDEHKSSPLEVYKGVCEHLTRELLYPDESVQIASETNQIFVVKLLWRISQFIASGKSFQCLECSGAGSYHSRFCTHAKDVLSSILRERLTNIT